MKIIYNNGSVSECPKEEELHILRHTAAHIMAQAIKRMFPHAVFAYGPATDKGFYYDLFRVRCFTQDDAHIFMRREQITTEIINVVHLIHEVYSKFGFKYFIELSTRPDDSMGSDEDWDAATNGLKQALEKLELPYSINEGDGAFYGPKIDFHLEDSLGRTWHCEKRKSVVK